ncbi:MAG: hypothetical protein AB7V55_08190 [Oscillospiraceae bacterium]
MANETPTPKKDNAQAKQKKEEQARAQRRRSRQLLGFAISVLVVVGAVSIIMNGISLIGNLMQNDDEIEEYRSRFESMVWFDLLPFDSVTQVDENSLKQIAIWGVMSQLGDTIGRSEYGEPLVPAADVDRFGVRLFGPDFRFSGHSSFSDVGLDLRYQYDEATQTYIAPSTGLMPYYLPSVVEIKREAGGVRRVVMGYVSTRTSDDRMVNTPDFDHPAKYMDYMLRRDGGEYYLYALQRNTTHIPETATEAASAPAVQPAFSLPPDSLPAASSSAASSSEDDSDAGSDISGSDDSDASDEASDADSSNAESDSDAA